MSVKNSSPWSGWKVTYNYSTKQEIDQNNPENDEILTSFSSEIYQEAIWRDVDDEGIVNSAGDLFDPPPTRDSTHLIAKIKSNHTSIPSWILLYMNAVNKSNCTIGGLGIAAKTAKVNRIDVGERKKRGDSVYYPLSVDIHIHRDGWRLEPLDQGLREVVSGATTLRRHIVDDKGEEITSPVLLDGEGAKLANPTQANAEFLDFQIYNELNFAALPGIS